MTIPAAPRASVSAPERLADGEWSALDTEAKRERLLRTAGEVFARDGLDAPMPAIAAAAGAGVASVYRQFPSKHELLAALWTRRLQEIIVAVRDASVNHGDCWSALIELLWTLIERQAADDFLGEARSGVAEHPDVVAANAEATSAFEELLAGARDEGRLRADASMLDLRLLFAATRAAKQVDPDAWPRMLELFIDALDADPRRTAEGLAR